MTGDQIGALLRAERRCVDFEVVDAGGVDGLVPQLHRICDRAAVVVADAAPGVTAALPGDVDWAPDPDEQHWQGVKLPGTRRQNVPWDGIRVVVDGVHDDVDAEPAVRRYGFVHGAVQLYHDRFEIRTFTARPQPDARLELGRGHLLEVVHPQIHPEAVEAALDRDGDAGLAAARRTVKDDDLARVVHLLHHFPHEVTTNSLILDEYRLSAHQPDVTR